MKQRLFILIKKIIFLIIVILTPLVFIPLFSSVIIYPTVAIRPLFYSFLTDGTLTIISLVLNSIGFYNIIFSKTKRPLPLLLTVMGVTLLMVNSFILVAMKSQYIYYELAVPFRDTMSIQIITVIVSLIWFAVVEFLIDLNQPKQSNKILKLKNYE